MARHDSSGDSEIRNLRAASYEEKLLKRVDQETWRTLDAKWRAEAIEIEGQI